MMRFSGATNQLVMRNLKVAMRSPLSLIFTLIQPILWMVLFTQNFRRIAGFSEFQTLGYTSYLSYVLPSIMTLTVLNGSARSGISMITDVNTGMMDKFLISPIRRSSIMLGRIICDAITSAGQCLIVLALAYAMGFTSKTGIAGVVVTLALCILLGMCACAFSDFLALRTRNLQVTMMINAVISLPLLFLSPAFFPSQLQPGWLQAIGKFNPVAYVVISGQNLMNLGLRWGQLLAALGVLALVGTLCFTASIRAFRRATSGSGQEAPGPVMRLMAKAQLRRRLKNMMPLPSRARLAAARLSAAADTEALVGDVTAGT